MSDETSSLTKPIQDLVEAIGVGLWIIGTAIFVAFGVPLIGFLGIQFVQMGGNWRWAGMFLFGVGVLILFLSWIFILGIFKSFWLGMTVTIFVLSFFIFAVIMANSK